MSAATEIASVASDATEPFRPAAPVPRPTPPNNFVYLRSLRVLPTLLRNPIESLSSAAFTEPVAYSAIFSNPIALIHLSLIHI